MIDKIEMNSLLDFYEGLLTKKQQDICNLYYRDDLSYQEIAELENISRAAVYDTVKRCNDELVRYESILHMNDDAEKRNEIYQQLETFVLEPSVKDLIDRLKHTEIEGGYYE